MNEYEAPETKTRGPAGELVQGTITPGSDILGEFLIPTGGFAEDLPGDASE